MKIKIKSGDTEVIISESKNHGEDKVTTLRHDYQTQHVMDLVRIIFGEIRKVNNGEK